MTEQAYKRTDEQRERMSRAAKVGGRVYMSRINYTIVLLVLLACGDSHAAISGLPWSTTYNCSEWNQDQGDPVCNGLEIAGGWKTSAGNREQITSAANYPAGGGGKGQRHWIGPGVNNNSGGTYIGFPSGQREIWIRWYMRFEAGFQFSSYTGCKALYFKQAGAQNHNVFGFAAGPYGSLAYIDYWGEGGANYLPSPDYGFYQIHGNSHVSDGSWHCYEVHIKSETGPAANNGILEAWVDGVRRIYSTTIDHGLASEGLYLHGILVGSNLNALAGDTDRYIDYDDIAISNTGYIGPLSASPPDPTPPQYTTLFTESFDDGNLASRDWFDDTSVDIDTVTTYSGDGSLRLAWGNNETAPPLIGAMRKTFTATDSLYTSQYWRFADGWIGSGEEYHPHLIMVLSDLDDPWGALAYNYLTTYIESSNLTLRMCIQDGVNINLTQGAVPNDLTAITEDRDVAGCNGTLTGSDGGDASCYPAGGGVYWNGRQWDGSSDFSCDTWHLVETYTRMNTISDGVAQADGIMRVWVDGDIVINNTHMVYRTGENPNMKWRTFVIAPWIGDGSPKAQTMWIDEVAVGEVSDNGNGEDTTPPSVTISTSPQTVSISSVSISFTVSDNIGVTSRKWRIGSAPDSTHGTDCTSPTTVTGLSVGHNTVYIGAGDAAGNWGSDSVVITYQPVASAAGLRGVGLDGVGIR